MVTLNNVDIAKRIGWDMLRDPVPDFLRRFDDAMILPLPPGTRLDIAIYANGSCVVDLSGLSNTHGRAASLADLPRLICDVWWRYKEP